MVRRGNWGGTRGGRRIDREPLKRIVGSRRGFFNLTARVRGTGFIRSCGWPARLNWPEERNAAIQSAKQGYQHVPRRGRTCLGRRKKVTIWASGVVWRRVGWESSARVLGRL